MGAGGRGCVCARACEGAHEGEAMPLPFANLSLCGTATTGSAARQPARHRVSSQAPGQAKSGALLSGSSSSLCPLRHTSPGSGLPAAANPSRLRPRLLRGRMGSWSRAPLPLLLLAALAALASAAPSPHDPDDDDDLTSSFDPEEANQTDFGRARSGFAAFYRSNKVTGGAGAAGLAEALLSFARRDSAPFWRDDEIGGQVLVGTLAANSCGKEARPAASVAGDGLAPRRGRRREGPQSNAKGAGIALGACLGRCTGGRGGQSPRQKQEPAWATVAALKVESERQTGAAALSQEEQPSR